MLIHLRRYLAALVLVVALVSGLADPGFHLGAGVAEAAYTKPWVGTGTGVGTGGTTVDVRSPEQSALATWIAIRNTGDTNDLKVSFDGGTTFITARAGESFSTVGRIASIYLKTTSSTTSYEFVAVGGSS